jgi:hypothetical protein
LNAVAVKAVEAIWEVDATRAKPSPYVLAKVHGAVER